MPSFPVCLPYPIPPSLNFLFYSFYDAVGGVGIVTYVVRADLATGDVVEYSHVDGLEGSGL